jgi:hypothetical protein
MKNIQKEYIYKNKHDTLTKKNKIIHDISIPKKVKITGILLLTLSSWAQCIRIH